MFINSFINHQILICDIIKVQSNSIFCILSVIFEDFKNENINSFKIHFKMFNSNFNSETELSLDLFFYFFINQELNQLSFYKFLYKQNFSKKQMKLILKNLNELLIMEGDEIFFGKTLEIKEKVFHDLPKFEIDRLKLPRLSLISPMNEKIENLFNINKRPSFKGFNVENNLLYVERNKTKKFRFHFSFGKGRNKRRSLEIKCFPINFSKEKDITISVYDPIKNKVDYCHIHRDQDFTKLYNILSIKSTKYKIKILNQNFRSEKNLVGTKLVFQRKIKSIKDRNADFYDIKTIILQSNNEIKLTNSYNCYHFFEIFRFTDYGKNYVKISVFQQKSDIFVRNCIIKIEIYPILTKTRKYKFIFTLNDLIVNLLPFNKLEKMRAEFNNNPNSLIKWTYHHVLPSIKTQNCVPYKKIIFSDHNFYWTIRWNALDKISKNIGTRDSFLEKKIHGFPVIFQTFKRINQELCIITVKKQNFLDYYNISFYFNKSCRVYSSDFQKSDLTKFEKEFIISTFPFFTGHPVKFNDNRYLNLCNEFSRMKNKLKKNENELGNNKLNNYEEIISFIVSIIFPKKINRTDRIKTHLIEIKVNLYFKLHFKKLLIFFFINPKINYISLVLGKSFAKCKFSERPSNTFNSNK